MAAASALFWTPVFTLWLSEQVSPAQVLGLQAFYYGAVVVLEVPSGHLSDRLGRRPVLVASSLCWAVGAAAVGTGGSLAVLAVGQGLLAAGMALASGTDSALLYDSLAALDRTDEHGAREGAGQAAALVALAVSGLAGGAAGQVDLRLAYGLSTVAGLLAAGLALQMVEPPSEHTEDRVDLTAPPRDPVVRWVLGVVVAGVVLVHVPYELGQPWLDALTGGQGTAALAGVVATGSLLLGAAAASGAHRVSGVLGPAATLLVGLAWQVAVVAWLAAAVHPAGLAPMLLKGVGWSMARPTAAVLVHPRLDPRLRATWLSVQSLAGRLAFSGCLALAAWGVGADGWSGGVVLRTMAPFAVGGLVVVALLAATRPRGS